MSIPNPKEATHKRIQRTEAYAEKVRLQFAQTVNAILALNKSMPKLEEGVMFSFDGESVRMQKQVEFLLRQLHSVATMAIKKGITLEWEQANLKCDKLVSSVFGKKVLETPEFSAWTNHNAKAREAFINRSDNGLNLSDRVWQSVQQLRDEMEVAMTVAIGEGDSAASMSKSVRKYLNDPDLMFRRFRYKDESGEWQRKWKKRIKTEDGKYRWIDYDRDDYKTGAGVYKSSAKNAMRVARTETNIAYRRADNERWAQMDFVLGQHIQLSKSHPKKDVCDKLQGDYPKEFVFDGWHPQCFCFSTPILADWEEQKKMEEAMIRGERYVSPRKITSFPQGFRDWVTEHADSIASSRDRGTEPYFIRNNSEAVDEILNPKPKELTTLEKAKIRHDSRTPEEVEVIKARWEERKKSIAEKASVSRYGDRILRYMDGISDVDTKGLRDAIKRGDTSTILAEAQNLKAIGKQILALSRLDNPMKVARDYSMKDAITINKAVDTTLSSMTSDLAGRKNKLEFEIKWVEDHKKYSTWKVAQDAYKKELRIVEHKIKIKVVADSVSDAILFAKTQSQSTELKTLARDMEASLQNEHLGVDILNQKASILNAKYQAEYAKIKFWIDLSNEAQTAIAYAATSNDKKFKALADKVSLLLLSKQGSTSVAKRQVDKLNDEYRKVYAADIQAKYGGTTIKTIDDIIAELGSKTPKTLIELREAINKFKYTDADLKANETEINALMKKLFDDNDFGMDIDHGLLESVFDKGFLNTFQTGSSHGYCGSSKTTGKIEQDHSRLKMAHRMFLPSTHGDISSSGYKGKQLARPEYEKYGHLLDRDKFDCYVRNKTHYGDVQVRFKKDKVLCTWTFDDSLHSSGRYMQPSLVSDPHVESFDEMCYHKPTSKSKWGSVADWQREQGTSYIELQYHGEMTIDLVESMTFSKNPESLISRDLIHKLLGKGIELWYIDKGKAVRYTL